jgi:hypothetical protein
VEKFGSSEEYRAVLRELVSVIRSPKLTDEATQRTRLEVEVFSAFAATQSFRRIVWTRNPLSMIAYGIGALLSLASVQSSV